MTTTKVPQLMPVLSAGRHRSPKQGACFMEFASYLAGERWSDHPACTHSVLAALARDVNDLSSDEARALLTPLIHRVVGLTSDDPALHSVIAVRAASAALPVANMERQRALAVGLVTILDQVDDAALRALADDAFREAPDSERWARHYLSMGPAPRPFGIHSALATVHTAAVGIAAACIENPDALLGALLRDVIGDTERFLGQVPAAVPALQHA